MCEPHAFWICYFGSKLSVIKISTYQITSRITKIILNASTALKLGGGDLGSFGIGSKPISVVIFTVDEDDEDDESEICRTWGNIVCENETRFLLGSIILVFYFNAMKRKKPILLRKFALNHKPANDDYCSSHLFN